MNAQFLRTLSKRTWVVWRSVISLLLLFSAVSVAYALGPWKNGQAADLVLGQQSFTTADYGNAPATMYSPYAVAVDPTTGKVFVADSGNNRVLRFAAGTALVTGAAAEAVFGQPDLYSHTGDTSRSLMKFPSGVFVDSAGRLWVSDFGNNRVLRFDNASSKGTGADADGVLGHSTYDVGGSGTGAGTMRSPRGLAVDSAGRLWVVDQGNNRILRFDDAANKDDGASADGLLGQQLWTTGGIGGGKNRFYEPMGLAVTSSGTLFLADLGNWRVLRFDNAASKAPGGDADAVLGQANFDDRIYAHTASGMGSTWGVGYDSEGRLYVGDDYNCRVLIFNNAATLPNGASANYVLGQTSLDANTCDVGPSALNSASGIYVDDAAHAVWVAEAGNNRVLRFVPLSTNANLSSLILSTGTLEPTFAPGTLSYTARVAHAVSSITVTPTTADANATVTVNGTPVASGSASSPISLDPGDNVVTVVVTAQDGTTTKTYTVTVTRVPLQLNLPLIVR